MAQHDVKSNDRQRVTWLAVRTILMEHWDPIDVKGEPSAANEYDNYIAKIMTLIDSGASEQCLAKHLDDIASRRMGFTSQSELASPAAKLLLALRASLEP